MSDIILNTSLEYFNPLGANPTKWSNTLKQFVGNLPTNCLSVFDHFVKLALKGLSRANNFFVDNIFHLRDTCPEKNPGF